MAAGSVGAAAGALEELTRGAAFSDREHPALALLAAEVAWRQLAVGPAQTALSFAPLLLGRGSPSGEFSGLRKSLLADPKVRPATGHLPPVPLAALARRAPPGA